MAYIFSIYFLPTTNSNSRWNLKIPVWLYAEFTLADYSFIYLLCASTWFMHNYITYFILLTKPVKEKHEIAKDCIFSTYCCFDTDFLWLKWTKNGNWPKLYSVVRLYSNDGGFQLEFVSIIRVINHMTCYKLSALISWNYSIQTGEQIL